MRLIWNQTERTGTDEGQGIAVRFFGYRIKERREMMRSLSQAEPGRSYTIKWIFASDEAMTFMQEHHIEEGSSVQLIQRCMHGVIIKVQGHCFAIGDEIADQIKV